MDIAIFQAWGIAIGGLSSLGSALIVLLLLNREAGPGSAFTFAAGYFSTYTTIGMAMVFMGANLFEGRGEDAGQPSVGPAVAMTVLGLLLMTAAIQTWRSPPTEENDEPPPPLFAKLDSFSPLQALLAGAVIPAINVKNLAIFLPAVALLAAAQLEAQVAVFAVLSTAMIFCTGLLVPLLIFTLIPSRSARWLAALREWIEANSTKLARVLLPIIASLLLAKGLYSLWQLFGPS